MERGMCIICNKYRVTLNSTGKNGIKRYRKKCFMCNLTPARRLKISERRKSKKHIYYKTSRMCSWRKQGINGITIEVYNHLFEKQKGKCFICNTHQDRLSVALSVDHNHTTGKIRGLLCRRCNQGIGLFNDNVEFLRKSIVYLSQ